VTATPPPEEAVATSGFAAQFANLVAARIGPAHDRLAPSAVLTLQKVLDAGSGRVKSTVGLLAGKREVRGADDAERDDEQRIVAEWASPLVQLSGDAQQYASITVL
jgi:hypothetical protein